MNRYHLFDTAIGRCAVAWTPRGLARVLLPESDVRNLTAQLEPHFRAHAGELPASVRTVVQKIQRHTQGHPQDFSDVVLDLDGCGPFAREVYRRSRQLPAGGVCTYGDVARALGRPGAARAVGQALGRNPVPIVVPCHRILAANGKPGGFSAPGGLDTKKQLLALEGYVLSESATARISLWTPVHRDAALRHLKGDPEMRTLIERVGELGLKQKSPAPFEAVCQSIIYQQLAGSAAASITARFTSLFDGRPSPRALLGFDDETLRAAGLSGAKIRALRAVAHAVLDGALPIERLSTLSDEEVTLHLTGVKGVGPWTAQMVLIFHLGRPDVFPVGDLGIRKAIQRLTGAPDLPPPDRLHAIAEKWQPWRTVATWYLWRSLSKPEKAQET